MASKLFATGTVIDSAWLNDVNTLVYTAITGTGSLVYSTSPTLVTPVLGVATATSINKITFTQPTTAATITLANNSTFTTTNNITYVGNFASTFTLTGTTSITLPTSGTVAITTQATDTFGAPTDVTTNNASASAHGFVPKWPNNTTTFYRGDGTYATPPSATATVAGYVPTPPNNTTTFLRGDATFAAVPATIINGYIWGFTLSNDGGTPNTILDIAAGYAADSTNAVMITGTTFTKKTGGSWVAGSNANGMGSGLTIANSTWYHVYAIINNGSFDVYFDTSATAANKPASTTAFRYIGSFKTNGSANILAFTQYGQRFIWSSPSSDLNSGVATVQTAVTLSTPLGFNTQAILQILYVPTVANNTATFYEAQASQPVYQLSDTAAAGGPGSGFYRTGYNLMTNTSSQIGYKTLNAGDPVSITTNGYINPHVSPIF